MIATVLAAPPGDLLITGFGGPVLVTVLSAALGGAVGTWLARALAHRTGIVNRPNPIVASHTSAIAYLGGLGVAFGTVAGLAVAHATGEVSAAMPWRILVGAALFGILGAADDLRAFRAGQKWILQCAAAVVAAWLTGMAWHVTGIAIVDRALVVLWILVLVNAVNLTDVCDGLVGGIALVCAAAFAAASAPAPVALATLGACAGFLVFNRPPASIFLGDAGSHWLGFILASQSVALAQRHSTWTGAAAGALILLPFLFEVTFITAARIRKGLPWWKGSPDHFSLRLQAAGWSRVRVDVTAVAAAIACGAASVSWLRSGIGARIAIAGVLITAVVMTWRALWRLPAPARRASGSDPGPRERRMLWIHQNFVTAREPGNSRPVGILSSLLADGWRVDVVTSQVTYLGDAPSRVRPDVVVERDGALTIHRLPAVNYGCDSGARARTYRDFILASLRYSSRLDRASLVYASSPPLPQILPNLVAALRFRCPMVVEIRDIWPAALVQGGILRSRWLTAGLEWLEALAYRVAAAVIVVAPAVRPYMRAMGVREEDNHLVVSGAVRPWSLADAEAGARWRSNHGLDEYFVLLYAGSFQDMNDITTLLHAAALSEKSHPNLVWVFAGNGRARPAVERAARELSNVHDLGSLPKDELLPVLFAADAGLIAHAAGWPLLETTIPGKQFDLMAAGRPILFAGAGQAAMILEAARAGVTVRAGDAGALVAAACELQHLSPETRAAMGESARCWIERHGRAAASGEQVTRISDSANRAPGLAAGRVVRAAFGAGADVARRRSQRAIAALYGSEHRADTIQCAFADWVTRDTSAATGPRIPRLLSCSQERETNALHGSPAEVSEPLRTEAGL